ncbi:glycogen synthase GlgA [Schinkia azotoformans]|uniref:glycogen synthase GlgA n=1 Tax=Schinkia azotoformans TaxID=1454 RepID=UPI002DBC3AC9|nr:glycogen synthase GlgA [Schinkia azotoformans]MEC1771169.1 glycogen synthase GlgA [Schinkia azotoformans]MED4364954.1 glycogen synthase GlgA [Schinkia azotoformans]
MNILFVVSECVPFIKSGGLADVAGALPKELKKFGSEVRVIMPKYGAIGQQFKDKMEKMVEINVQLSWRNQYCGIEKLEYEGIVYYFIDNEYYFKRDTMYGHYDDGERFSYFCRAVLEAIPHLDFNPEILHCHDWHTGMVPFLLNAQYRDLKEYADIRTIFTIHNLQFQGIFPREILGDLLNLDDSYFDEQLEFYGCVNFMKAAIVSSDLITTVSPTYMNEIQMPYYGERLDGLLRSRHTALKGILNGIDADIYNPGKDPSIIQNYDQNSPENKIKNKLHLQKMFGLEENANIPLISIISRLTSQKGLDLVKLVFDEVIAHDIQFIVLGTGDTEFEDYFRTKESLNRKKVRAYIGFNEELAHQIYAGSDLFLMPSKFEPCGLGQLIALRYGTIPIVRETGGLNDTVTSYNEKTQTGNGFTFKNYNAHDMLYTVQRALHFYNQKHVWEKLVKTAMAQDYSWSQSAQKYNGMYKVLAEGQY